MRRAPSIQLRCQHSGRGYVSVINLRLANEAGADVDAGRAAAQAAGAQPFTCRSTRRRGRSGVGFPEGGRRQVQPAGVHSLRVGQSCRRGVDDGSCRTGGPSTGRKPRPKPSACRTHSSWRLRPAISKSTANRASRGVTREGAARSGHLRTAEFRSALSRRCRTVSATHTTITGHHGRPVGVCAQTD